MYCSVETVPKYSNCTMLKSIVEHYLRDVLLVMSGSLSPFIFSNETKNLIPYCVSPFSVIIIYVILQNKISLSRNFCFFYGLIFSAS